MDQADLLQNDLRIRAAFSHSFSMPVGQKASDPILFVSLLTGPPNFSNAAHPLSKAALPPSLVFDQADGLAALFDGSVMILLRNVLIYLLLLLKSCVTIDVRYFLRRMLSA